MRDSGYIIQLPLGPTEEWSADFLDILFSTHQTEQGKNHQNCAVEYSF